MTTACVLDDMDAIAQAVITAPDRDPTMERQGFINGLEILFTRMKAAGTPVHPFYVSMLNRLCQDDPQNAYPHFDQAFTKPAVEPAEREKRGYMERMRVLVPVALVSALQGTGLTVAQAVHAVVPALTKAGYPWPEGKTPAKALSGWHTEASRKTKKPDKVEQLERAMKIVAEELGDIARIERRPQYQRTELIRRISNRVAAF